MVTNTALATICIESGLYKHIIHTSTTLASSIEVYKEHLDRARALEYQLADTEGRMPGQYWVDIEPPKVTSNIPLVIMTVCSDSSLRCRL